MNSKLLIVYFVVFICLFTSCHGNNNTDTVYEVQIESIDSKVTVNEGYLYIENTVKLDKKYEKGELYLHSSNIVSSIKSDSKIQLIREEEYTKIIFEGENLLNIDYIVEPKRINSKINFFHGLDQFFLLPELRIFISKNKNLDQEKKIKVEINNSEHKDSYSKSRFLITGNFIRKTHNNINVYIPENLEYDSNKLLFILKEIENSFSFFLDKYDVNPLKGSEIDLFFLNRRGGHCIEDGLILDQHYILPKRESRKIRESIIYHEVAHLWWGRYVKSDKCKSLIEGLAEYSAIFYLRDKYENVGVYLSKMNSQIESSLIAPINYSSVSTSSKNYYEYSYLKLPVIFNEINLKLGTEGFIESLKKLFDKEYREDLSFQKFSRIFENRIIQSEFLYDVNSRIPNWPDFYIGDVKGNSVVFHSENVNFDEVVPVVIYFDSKTLRDTLVFSKEKKTISIGYDTKPKKVIIDPNFDLNQSVLLNDLWRRNESNSKEISSKYYKRYDNKYYKFSNEILSFLFNEEGVGDLKKVTRKKDIIQKLIKVKRKVNHINLIGSNLYLRNENYFKIIICFLVDNEYHYGKIEGVYKYGDGVFNNVFLDKILDISI